MANYIPLGLKFCYLARDVIGRAPLCSKVYDRSAGTNSVIRNYAMWLEAKPTISDSNQFTIRRVVSEDLTLVPYCDKDRKVWYEPILTDNDKPKLFTKEEALQHINEYEEEMDRECFREPNRRLPIITRCSHSQPFLAYK